MLKYLRRQGVGCAGTVRTTKTTTEETFEDAARVELQAKDVSVKGRARQKVAKERFSSSLMRLKTQFTKHMDGEVLQAAWRDNQVVLFASTVAEPIQVIMKLRRRSKMSQNNKGIFEKAFGNEPVRLLGIPQIINDYNYHKTKQVKRRTWRPLLYFLLDLTLNNAYRLSLYSDAAAAKRSGHKRFLYDLIKQLFDRGTRLCNAGAKRKRLDDVVVAEESSYRSANLYKQAKTCVLCAERGRRQHKSQPPRVALGHVQGNLQLYKNLQPNFINLGVHAESELSSDWPLARSPPVADFDSAGDMQ
ncbi:hypothetical protein BU23DRAFT_559283 [Bimuria novae-zelandiae CBS 107.79]|uniref:PiggyBac transposable element-derived protein domain-containing protein n=1 Tax=Bimuria novae-zelandiae CBS 107.79 TaxID=1447943 RepID=A0A6A5UR15_9PLEO|nr:hypothetical protein BU23DRAFT_559283 [Bimuria novae-zelandiae CBS 107.79]